MMMVMWENNRQEVTENINTDHIMAQSHQIKALEPTTVYVIDRTVNHYYKYN